jgi:glycosyltransferase involved in cell wall biosynthesis
LHRDHFGLTQALNYGFSFASGSILTWTSADNLINTKGLATLIKSLEENNNAGMVYSDYSLINEEGNLLYNSNFRNYDQDPDNKCVIRTFRPNKLNCYLPDNFIGPFFAYRREVALRIGAYRELKGFEDYDYWLRINKVCEIIHVPTHGDLYFYRIHQNTLTARAKENYTYRKLIKHLRTNELAR